LGRFTRPALALSALLVAIFGLLQKLKADKAIEQEAKVYASEVFTNLADYAAAVAHEPVNTARDGFVSVTQLRDDVLRNEFSSSRRKKLWRGVEKLVEQNSNVRTRIGSLDSGDVGRGWKWIGAIRQLDDSDISGGSRRGSGRYSLPPIHAQTPEMTSSPMTEIDIANPVGFRRWNDASRPQF
jgi:Man1-Src1p-C-terminal domain